MSKKKIIALALSVAMLAVVIIGASLAYFTDTKEATNTFTVGGVKIELIEQQRKLDEDGNKTTTLENFEQDKILMPIVGSAQGEKDEIGMSKAENYGDKMITVKNTGKSDAYVRAYFAIPTALDDGYETFNAGANVLHFNFGTKVEEGGAVKSTDGVEWLWTAGSKWNYYETTIDGVSYNVYYADYYQPLEPGETTERLVNGVYLDASFDMNSDGNYTYFNINTNKIEVLNLTGLLDNEGNIGTISCPVKAVAVQAEGFDNAADAVDAAFGEHFNPFGGEATNWQN